jgi:hypothetical protein
MTADVQGCSYHDKSIGTASKADTFPLLLAVAYLEIWKGGQPKYLMTFFGTQTNLHKFPLRTF